MNYKKQHISQQLIFANLSVQEGFMANDLIQLIDRFQTFPCRSKCLSYLQRFFFKQDITKCCEESVWVAFAFPDGETGMWHWILGYLEALELSTIPIVSGPPPGTAPAEQSACLSAEQTHCLQLPPAWSGAQRFPLASMSSSPSMPGTNTKPLRKCLIWYWAPLVARAFCALKVGEEGRPLPWPASGGWGALTFQIAWCIPEQDPR